MAEGDNKSSNMLVSSNVVCVYTIYNDSDLELFSVALLRAYISNRSLILGCLGLCTGLCLNED